MGLLQTCGRALLRWYLRHFPLRNGKQALYDRFQRQLAPGERLVTCELPAGIRVRLDLQDPSQRKTFFFGTYDERHELQLIPKILDPGEVFWDIGAHIGVYSLLAARRVGEDGLVAAFEPGQIAYEMFRANIALNHLENILAFRVTVTDREGEAVLYAAGSYADGGANLFQPGPGQIPAHPCRTITLDHFCRDLLLPPPDFIKMDIEGAELAALRGADLILSRHHPLLLMEVKDSVLKTAGADKAALQDLLKHYGYMPACLHRRRWYVLRDIHQACSRNLLWYKPSVARHREKAARIPLKGV